MMREVASLVFAYKQGGFICGSAMTTRAADGEAVYGHVCQFETADRLLSQGWPFR